MSIVGVVEHPADTRVSEVNVETVEASLSQEVSAGTDELSARLHVRQEPGHGGGAKVWPAHRQHGTHVLVDLLQVVEAFVPRECRRGGITMGLEWALRNRGGA